MQLLHLKQVSAAQSFSPTSLLFNSTAFLLFFVLTGAVYFSFRKAEVKNLILLLSSYIFYAHWDWRFLGLIFISTLIDYFCGWGMSRSNEHQKLKKKYLYLSIFSNLATLGFFKYFNFFNESSIELLRLFGLELSPLELSVVLPVGISFYTFQSMSYTIDIYRKEIQAEKSFLTFALYVAFFPQLVAGPIERAKNLLPQFQISHKFSQENFYLGLEKITWGLFKKIVIADNFAVVVDSVFNDVDTHNPLRSLVGIYFFAIQIYCDFSGYSDVAIGVAKILGFELNPNFRTPYFSKNISEFWKRWHISLSSWLKDYLYIPLGGNRGGIFLHTRNLLITMILGGLWHGASYNFIVWGGLHGLFLFLYKLYSRANIPWEVPRFISMIFVFHLVCFSWIFFRTETLGDSLIFIQSLFNFGHETKFGLFFIFEQSPWHLLKCFGFLIFMLLIEITSVMESKKHTYTKGALMLVMFALILIFSKSGRSFVYFQF